MLLDIFAKSHIQSLGVKDKFESMTFREYRPRTLFKNSNRPNSFKRGGLTQDSGVGQATVPADRIQLHSPLCFLVKVDILYTRGGEEEEGKEREEKDQKTKKRES